MKESAHLYTIFLRGCFLHTIFLRGCFLLCFFLSSESVRADSVNLIHPLSFGTVVVDPAGESIEIDASVGTSLPRVFTSGRSYITGGNSGLISVYSDTPGQMITVDYPPSVNLESGGSADLILDGISERSTFSAVSSSIGPIDFHIGGLLHINSGQPTRNFSGTMTITITVTNP